MGITLGITLSRPSGTDPKGGPREEAIPRFPIP
jgi:hypothetical protein